MQVNWKWGPQRSVLFVPVGGRQSLLNFISEVTFRSGPIWHLEWTVAYNARERDKHHYTDK